MRYFGILLLALWACAPKTGLHQEVDWAKIWAELTPAIDHGEHALANFSLHIQTSERTGRMVGQLWGYPTSVMRLDLSSSAGGIMAMIRESDNIWTTYLPSENKAYHDYQAQKGWSYFNIPVPFDVRQVTNLLVGNLGEILSNKYSKGSLTRNNWTLLEFNQGDVAFLEISPKQDILILKGRPGWTLTCENPYQLEQFSGKQLYAKFTFLSVSGEKAILRVKSLESGHDWDLADLDLNLPGNVQWVQIIHQ